MEFRYQISREDYLNAMISQLRQRRKGFFNLLTFAVMTVGQGGYTLWYALKTRPDPDRTVLICCLSAGIFAIQTFYQCALRLRAEQNIRRYQKKGLLSEDFWKTQILKLDDDILTLRCGNQKLAYDCAYFKKAETVGSFLVLTFQKGRELQQLMIPEGVFKKEGSRQAFLDSLKAAGQASIRSGMRELTEIGTEEGGVSLSYTMSRKTFEEALVRCTRRIYLTREGWPLNTIARVAGAAFLLGNVAAGVIASPSFILYAALISIILLLPFLSAFTPIQTMLSRQNAGNVFAGLEEMAFCLTVLSDRLVWQSESFMNEIPFEKLAAADRDDRFAYLFLNDRSSAFIPLDENNRTEIIRNWLLLETVAERNRGRQRKR